MGDYRPCKAWYLHFHYPLMNLQHMIAKTKNMNIAVFDVETAEHSIECSLRQSEISSKVISSSLFLFFNSSINFCFLISLNTLMAINETTNKAKIIFKITFITRCFPLLFCLSFNNTLEHRGSKEVAPPLQSDGYWDRDLNSRRATDHSWLSKSVLKNTPLNGDRVIKNYLFFTP